jgi:hypothetical protein
MAATAVGAAADAAAGELVGTETFSDGADSGTGGVLGAGSTLVSFCDWQKLFEKGQSLEIPFLLFSLVTIVMAIKLDNVNFAVSGTGCVIGADFTSLSVLFFSSDWTTGAAAAADAVTGVFWW